MGKSVPAMTVGDIVGRPSVAQGSYPATIHGTDGVLSQTDCTGVQTSTVDSRKDLASRNHPSCADEEKKENYEYP
jgi:hypothetical protein